MMIISASLAVWTWLKLGHVYVMTLQVEPSLVKCLKPPLTKGGASGLQGSCSIFVEQCPPRCEITNTCLELQYSTSPQIGSYSFEMSLLLLLCDKVFSAKGWMGKKTELPLSG